MDFDAAFDQLIGNEGRLSMDPRDRGNWTTGTINSGVLKGSKYGISAMSYPMLDIQNLTLDQARDIYRRDFWAAAGCDAVPEAVKFDLFDMAVNSGVKAAIKTLQRCVGTVEDGIIGVNTLMKLRDAAPNLRAAFSGHRLMFMTSLPTWDTQGRGWANRIGKNLTRAAA